MIVLDDAAVVEDKNFVVIDDGLQTVCNCDDCAVAQFAESLLDLGVGGIIDGCGCFVHHQNAGVLEQGAGETQELALALREVGTGLRYLAVKVIEDVFVVDYCHCGAAHAVTVGVTFSRGETASGCRGGGA